MIRLTGQEVARALNYFALLGNGGPYLPQGRVPNTFDLLGESFLDPGGGGSCDHGHLSCSFSWHISWYMAFTQLLCKVTLGSQVHVHGDKVWVTEITSPCPISTAPQDEILHGAFGQWQGSSAILLDSRRSGLCGKDMYVKTPRPLQWNPESWRHPEGVSEAHPES